MSKSLPAKTYTALLRDIKDRVRQSQARAALSVNAEMIGMYWDIGRTIDARQKNEGWGTAVIPRLARELRNELPEEKGFSERNIKSMLAFYRTYPDPAAIVQQPAAQLKPSGTLSTRTKGLTPIEKVPQPVAQLPDSLLWSIPWGHHVMLMLRVKDLKARIWYMAQTLADGWSRSVLQVMIKSEAHARQGQAVSNFHRLLPSPQSDLVQQTLKDPYIFDFLTLQEPFHERELETNLLHQLERFLLELGQGFAFVGRQYALAVGDRDFIIELLFYHLKLRCFVVIDLKVGEFKPEHAGQMNFYLSVVDDKVRHAADAPSIGLVLCQDRNQIVAEYALRGVEKPIGVFEYEITRLLPSNLKSALPTVEEIEAELADSTKPEPKKPAKPKSKKRKKTRGELTKKERRK
jgi:predicted nuclease of restriction endonuclease-like (RecB) superfamily